MAHLTQVDMLSRTTKMADEKSKGNLTAEERRKLPEKDFALPGKGDGPEGKQSGSYPIPDEAHAKSALARVEQHGTPEEIAKVRAAVKNKFPDMDVKGGKKKSPLYTHPRSKQKD